MDAAYRTAQRDGSERALVLHMRSGQTVARGREWVSPPLTESRIYGDVKAIGDYSVVEDAWQRLIQVRDELKWGTDEDGPWACEVCGGPGNERWHNCLAYEDGVRA